MKILIYTDPEWAFGSIYYDAAKHLYQSDINCDILNWGKSYSTEQFELLLKNYDYIVSTYSGIPVLMNGYQVDPDRLIMQAHDEQDLVWTIKDCGVEIFDKLAGYAVVSNSLFSSSMTLGILRLPAITPLGINCDKYQPSVSTQCEIVGYAAVHERPNAYGLERKRGALAQQAIAVAGLTWKPQSSICYQAMPSYYNTIDALVCSSLQEGAGLPALEAAAAGKLVISTAVGHWPQCMDHSMGITAPWPQDEFVEFVSDQLKFYASSRAAYQSQCQRARQAALHWDWKFQIKPWRKFFQSLPRKIS